MEAFYCEPGFTFNLEYRFVLYWKVEKAFSNCCYFFIYTEYWQSYSKIWNVPSLNLYTKADDIVA